MSNNPENLQENSQRETTQTPSKVSDEETPPIIPDTKKQTPIKPNSDRKIDDSTKKDNTDTPANIEDDTKKNRKLDSKLNVLEITAQQLDAEIQTMVQKVEVMLAKYAAMMDKINVLREKRNEKQRRPSELLVQRLMQFSDENASSSVSTIPSLDQIIESEKSSSDVVVTSTEAKTSTEVKEPIPNLLQQEQLHDDYAFLQNWTNGVAGKGANVLDAIMAERQQSHTAQERAVQRSCLSDLEDVSSFLNSFEQDDTALWNRIRQAHNKMKQEKKE